MRVSLAVLVAAFAATAFAEDAKPGVQAKHKITAVTVYQGNALITREVSVPEGAGAMELLISPLPPRTIATSPYAEGENGIRVLNTRYRTVAIKEDTREEVRKLEAQIKTLLGQTQKLTADLKQVGEQSAFLTKLEGFTGVTLTHLTDKGMLNAEATIALSKFIMTTKVERSKEAVELQQKLQELAEQTEFAKRQLAERSAGISRTERLAVITIDKANAAAGTIRLNYLVDAVAWRPTYKFRAGKEKEPVSVEYLAAVQQQTGEDWQNVSVQLSTAQPMLNAAPPDLRALEVTAIPVTPPGAAPGGGRGAQVAQLPAGTNLYKGLKDRADQGRQQSQALANTLNWVEAAKCANDAAAFEQTGELLATREELVDFNRRVQVEGMTDGPSVTYRLKGNLSLPSRNDDQVLEVARLTLAPEYFYKAVPVLTSNVYRQANLSNQSDYVFFPGEATMYIGADFVGRMEMPLVAIGKQFSVSFGVDPQLSVQRTLVNKNRVTSGGNQVMTFDYRLLVNSYKKELVKVQVWDRLPKGEAVAIATTLTSQKPDLSGDALYVREDRPKNLLRWDVDVKPTQHGELAYSIDYSYKLELDKQMQIGAAVAK